MPSLVGSEMCIRDRPPNPCNPTPCGPNSQCQIASGQAQCSCLFNMIGAAPNCRPECLDSSDCQSTQTCLNQRCIDPCPGLCGANTDCRVLNHSPFCSCIQGYTGDAFSDCKPSSVVGKNFNFNQDPLPLPYPKTDKLQTNRFLMSRSWPHFFWVPGFITLPLIQLIRIIDIVLVMVTH